MNFRITFGHDYRPLDYGKPRISDDAWKEYQTSKRQAKQDRTISSHTLRIDSSHCDNEDNEVSRRVQGEICGDDLPTTLALHQVQQQSIDATKHSKQTGNRRAFLKLLAQGGAVLGSGLLGYYGPGDAAANHVADMRKEMRLKESLQRQVAMTERTKDSDEKQQRQRRNELQQSLREVEEGRADLSKAPSDPIDPIPEALCRWGTAIGFGTLTSVASTGLIQLDKSGALSRT